MMSFLIIEKESLDARGENLVNSYTVLADIKNAEKHLRKKDVQIGKEEKYISPEQSRRMKDQ